MNNKDFKVVDIKIRNIKYPIIIEDTEGHKYKISEDVLNKQKLN